MLAFILHIRFLDNYRILKLFFSLFCSLYISFKLNLLLNGLKKCPDCYGNELCRFFQNQQIQLTSFSFLLSIINPNLTKSVYYGVFNDSFVVIKRKIGRAKEQSYFIKGELIANQPENFILCPSVDNVQFLFDQINGRIEDKKLWAQLKSSIEPLLLMYFQTQGTWPFPKYQGACGDLIVQEYKGEPLTNFVSSVYKKRIFLAANLLKVAETLTFGHPHLALYFTDYSLDNLVVDSTGEIFLIDLDNVIISNKSAFEGSTSLKRSTHNSEILDEYEYAFSPSDICQHYLSDHNYFSVCKYLLSHPKDGILKNSSAGVEKNKKLLWLLDECSQPKLMSDRFSAAHKLQILLGEILNNYNYS